MRTIELYTYNPGQSSPEELEATFVAREAVLRGILDDLAANAAGPVNQHALIIGPRGTGKTHFLHMIKRGVMARGALTRSYLPVQTAEEEYSISSLRDLFGKILQLLVDEGEDAALRSAMDSMARTADDDDACDMAIEALKGVHHRRGQKILVLLDNLDLILGDQIRDDAQIGRLRDVLMNEPFLVLIAAAPTFFKEVSGYGRPFYNFFKLFELEDLSFEHMKELFWKRAEWDGSQEILQRKEEVESRLRAVYHLTGGNPRLVLMLYQFHVRTELPEVRAALQMLLNDLTPYYKHRMESLSAQQRKVLDTFARLGHPATPTELAQEVHLPVNQVNAILKRLSDGGFVSLAPQKRRKVSLYLVSERLFRIWCQMRFAPATRKRLEFFIEFIRIWYTQSEWKQEADRLIRDYRDAAVAKGVQAAGRFMDYLDHMVDAAPRPDWGVALEDTAVRVCVETGDCRRAENMLRERLKTETLQGKRERAANSWFLLAYVYRSWNKPTQAIEAWEQAVACKSDFHEALNNWGAALRELAGNERGEERERLLQEAIRRYEMALSVKPGSPVVLDNWGNALADLAESKTGNEQGRLLEMASQKVSEAIQLAIARGEQDKVAFYHAHFVRIVLLRCLLAVEREDRGTARELFALALEHSRLGDPESVRRALTEFFQNATREPHVSMCEELFGVMHQKGMVQEAALLLPFAKAVEYWRKGKDEEVLDRLNPEVREIVEAIIRGDRRPSD